MTGWRILVPVKELSVAKSRTGFTADVRRRLTVAMLADVLTAAKTSGGVEQVTICTSDPQLLDEFPGESIWFTSPGGSLNTDLAEALADPAEAARATAVVVADLPCMTSQDLESVLDLAHRRTAAFVSSCDGGTTVLAAVRPDRMVPSFGRKSAAAHRPRFRDASPYVGIGCRLDVDTADALARGWRIGVGDRTRECLLSIDVMGHLLDSREPTGSAGTNRQESEGT